MSTDSSDVMPTINRHVIEATVELFESLDLPLAHSRRSVAPAPELAAGEVVVASVGYTAEGLRGNLLMLARTSLMSTWESVLLGNSGDAALCDTLAEFSNMLLGRLKNRLLAHAVVLSIAIPTGAIGREMRLSGPPEGQSRWHCFGEGERAVFVRLDGVVAEGFTLAEPTGDAAAGATAAAEGEMFLF